jgi:hypothetical protein
MIVVPLAASLCGWQGLKKVMLHASMGDDSQMRERLAYSVFREMGPPSYGRCRHLDALRSILYGQLRMKLTEGCLNKRPAHGLGLPTVRQVPVDVRAATPGRVSDGALGLHLLTENPDGRPRPRAVLPSFVNRT